ncbi:MAG: hypothetical protein GYA34_13500 [Chloroflexi bacterium]|nr:hypothetical protein [Chloroflexota bacterium]
MDTPSIIDPQTINIFKIPVIWSPVQCELSFDVRAQELEEQAQRVFVGSRCTRNNFTIITE